MNEILDLLDDGFCFHDVEPVVLSTGDSNEMVLKVDDLNSNLADLPEYPGYQSGSLIFTRATILKFDLTFAEDIKIYDLFADRLSGNRVHVKIQFSPSGILEIECDRALVRTDEGDALS